MRPAFLLLIAAAVLPAVDVIGDKPPAYLKASFQAGWRMKPLAEVLAELGRQIERPVVRSNAVAEIEGKRLVVLVDDHKGPLGDCLALLERSQDLRLTAEPLRLRVETWEDFRNRQRRPVDLNLRDYGIFLAPKNFPGPALGLPVNGGGGGGFSIFGGGAGGAGDSGRDPAGDEVVKWMDGIAGSTGAEMRGHGNVHLLATVEEENALRAALAERLARQTRRSSWQAVFGTLASGDALPSGVVPQAAAIALAARLDRRQVLSVQALNNQRVSADNRREQTQVTDLDIVGGGYDPRTETVRTGRAMDIIPRLGFGFTQIGYHLAWVDPIDGAFATFTDPGHPTPPTAVTRVEKAGDKETTTTSTTPGQSGSGSRQTIALPAEWNWTPRGESWLPGGSSLVLVAEHPAGRAVIILMETP
ncbi:hypothetical protein LBMAG53_34200 [Planctomycetota bacterium]|nr:hypothetical protein LBMAG53_34200 [Planctomycetota bacterium]